MNQQHFNPITREFTHSKQAQENPLVEEQFIPVAFSTFDPLPDVPEGHVAVRTGEGAYGEAWEVKEDNRGVVWDTTTHDEQHWSELGPLPAELTKTKPAALVLTDAKQARATVIRAVFATQTAQPVDAAGAQWNGGMNSALSIDGAVRLAEQAGATEIALFDFANNEHVVDIATGKTIAAAVAQDYQIKLATKQQLLRDIESATIETIANIEWSES